MKKQISALLDCLPSPLHRTLLRLARDQQDFYKRLSEVRLRQGHHAALVLDGENQLLPLICGAAEIKETLDRLCNGSLYLHRESMRQGYLSAFGCRVGLGGRAVIEHGMVEGISDVTSLCIRLPHTPPSSVAAARAVLAHMEIGGGLLIYSPPGGGKTTMLRELARALSCGSRARRVALVDSRGELYGPDFSSTCQIDVLRYYPLAQGIEIASRTLSPQVLVCDEVGNMQEAEALLAVRGCGLPLFVSAHAGSLQELLSRPPIRMLEQGGAFATYLGIQRLAGRFIYTLQGADGRLLFDGQGVAACCS